MRKKTKKIFYNDREDKKEKCTHVYVFHHYSLCD